jgi:hypothetical protein
VSQVGNRREVNKKRRGDGTEFTLQEKIQNMLKLRQTTTADKVRHSLNATGFNVVDN